MVMNKQFLRSYLYKIQMQIVADIENGVLNRANKRDVMRLVRERVRKTQFLNEVEKNELLLWGVTTYRHTVAGASGEKNVEKRAENIYSVLKNDVSMLERTKNELINSVEYRSKHEKLVNLFLDQDNRLFYCTVVDKCASDHAEFQGKFYYREGIDYSEEEWDWIKKNGLLSINEVTLEKPFLGTRRNCRHRFVPISFKRAQMGYESHERDYVDISYEEEQLRNYRDRHRMLLTVKKMFEKNGTKPPQLEIDLKRTNVLVREWGYRAKKSSKK